MLPLHGIRVVELGQNMAAPYCGQILGTLGADIVKVERPEGDDARGFGPPFFAGASVTFHSTNQNKRGICLDLREAKAIDWLKDYVKQADIVIHNFRPGVIEPLGLGYEDLRAVNPRLIFGAVSGFGAHGPLRERAGYDVIAQAISGMFSVNGDPAGRTARVGISALDIGSGMWLAIGCLAALRQRDATGLGCLIETSLFETAIGFLNQHITLNGVTGKPHPRERAGVRKVALFTSWETLDGEIVIAPANDRLFQRLAIVAGRPDWATDPRYRTNADRVAHRDELTRELAQIMLTRSTADWEQALDKANVPCAPINGLGDVITHPQTSALEMLYTSPITDLKLPRLPLSFDGKRPPVRREPPSIGQHNTEIIADALSDRR